MFETQFYNSIKNHNYINIFLLSFVSTILLGILNYFVGGNALFLVAFISLAIAFPIIKYFKKLNSEEIKRVYSANKLINSHLEEIIAIWSIFIGITIGFYITIVAGLTTQLQYHIAFTNQLQGMITNIFGTFLTILINNLTVSFFTFLLSILIFSGFIFVIVWNASLVSYFIYTLQNSTTALITSILLIPHALLEIGGYVLAGTAGGLLAYRFDVWSTFSKEEKKEFRKDFTLLIISSIVFIFLGAMIETL